MTPTYAAALVFGLILAAPWVAEAQTGPQPVTPNASPEAVKLLEYLYSISGRHILTGQHCVPLAGSTCLPSMHKQTQQYYPAVFGQDFGFTDCSASSATRSNCRSNWALIPRKPTTTSRAHET